MNSSDVKCYWSDGLVKIIDKLYNIMLYRVHLTMNGVRTRNFSNTRYLNANTSMAASHKINTPTTFEKILTT
jgi:hypothetical protein